MEGVTDTAALARGRRDTCQARLRPPGPEPYPLLVNILEVSGVPSARLVAAGFSNGLSPVKVRIKVAQWCLTLCDPTDCSPWNSPGQNTLPSPGDLPNPGISYIYMHIYKYNVYIYIRCISLYFFSSLFYSAKSLQSCPILCDPIDGSPPGSPIRGILQARTLEWVAISFSNA